MNTVTAIIIALQALNVHGSKLKCQKLSMTIAKVARHEIWVRPEKPVHFDEDMKEIIEFNKLCMGKK